MAELNEKQKRFAQEYIKNPNATEAAKAAGYSEKTAGSQGQRLLKKVEIKKLIASGNVQRSERVNVTQDMVIKELARGAFAELDMSEMKWSDKMKCLELLSKHLGLLDGSGAGSKDKSNVKDGLLEAINRLGIGGKK